MGWRGAECEKEKDIHSAQCLKVTACPELADSVCDMGPGVRRLEDLRSRYLDTNVYLDSKFKRK